MLMSSVRMGSQTLRCTMVATFTLLQLMLTLQMSAATGEIISAPKTQITTEDSTVLFNCHAFGDSYWKIDGTQVGLTTRSTFVERGFHFHDEELSTNPLEYNMTITAPASLENNNTAIQCKAPGNVLGQVAASAIVRLIIASPPSPAPLSLNLLNATSILLSWSTPFTHEGFEVEHYNVTMQSTASVEVLEWQPETSPVEFIREGGIAQNCEALTFTLTSTNAIGVSSATTVSGGFPTVPGPLPSLINTEVSFLQDGTPQVEIDFQLPGLCDFQTSEYTIMIEKEDGEGPIILGPMTYTSSDSLSVETEVGSGLEIGHTYTVSVFVESLAGKSDTSTATFSTIWSIQPTDPTTDPEPTSDPTTVTEPTIDPTTVTEPTIDEEEGRQLEGGENDDSKGVGNQLLYIVTGASVGVAATLVVAGILLTIVLLYKKRQNRNTAATHAEDGKKRQPMVSNPIYEPSTPIYESIEDPPWKSLVKEVRDPIESKDPRYYEMPPPMPPRKFSHVELMPEEKEAQVFFRDMTFPGGDECYTIMNSAGTLSRQTSMVSPPPVADEYVTVRSPQN